MNKPLPPPPERLRNALAAVDSAAVALEHLLKHPSSTVAADLANIVNAMRRAAENLDGQRQTPSELGQFAAAHRLNLEQADMRLDGVRAGLIMLQGELLSGSAVNPQLAESFIDLLLQAAADVKQLLAGVNDAMDAAVEREAGHG